MDSREIMSLINSKVGSWQFKIAGLNNTHMTKEELSEYLLLMYELKSLVAHQFEATFHTQIPLVQMADEQYEQMGGDEPFIELDEEEFL